MDPFDRILQRALIALTVLALVVLLIGTVGTVVDRRRNHELQQECRSRGGEVVLLDGGAWRCVGNGEDR